MQLPSARPLRLALLPALLLCLLSLAPVVPSQGATPPPAPRPLPATTPTPTPVPSGPISVTPLLPATGHVPPPPTPAPGATPRPK